MLAPDSLSPMTTCEIELDTIAADILNSNEDLTTTLPGSNQKVTKKSGNPGLEIIWKDEQLRRQIYNIDLKENPLTPPTSPPKQLSPSFLTDSEQFWSDQFDEALDSWREQGVLDVPSESQTYDKDATINFDPNSKVDVYPDETANESLLQAASFVEQHLKSLSLENRGQSRESPEEDIFLDKSEFFNDTLVDEDVISQQFDLGPDDPTVINLDSDDMELVELLRELKDEENQSKSASKSQKSDSSDSLILTQHLSQVSKDKYENEVAETLEMSQILEWDDDDFFDDDNYDQTNKKSQEFDDDSFWENYNFDSLLD